jgi:hypothetical protein
MKKKHPAHKTAHTGHYSTIFLVEGPDGICDCMFAEGGYPEQEGPVSNDRASRPAYRRRPSSRISIHPDAGE